MTTRYREFVVPNLGALLGTLERAGQCTVSALLPPTQVYSLTLERTERALADPLEAMDPRLRAALGASTGAPASANTATAGARSTSASPSHERTLNGAPSRPLRDDVRRLSVPSPRSTQDAMTRINELLAPYRAAQNAAANHQGQRFAETRRHESGSRQATRDGLGAQASPQIERGSELARRANVPRAPQLTAPAELGYRRAVTLDERALSRSELRAIAFEAHSAAGGTAGSVSRRNTRGDLGTVREHDAARSGGGRGLDGALSAGGVANARSARGAASDGLEVGSQPRVASPWGAAFEGRDEARSSASTTRNASDVRSITRAANANAANAPAPSRMRRTGSALTRLVDEWQRAHPDQEAAPAPFAEATEARPSSPFAEATTRAEDGTRAAPFEAGPAAARPERAAELGDDLIDEERMAQALERLLRRESERYGIRLEDA